MTNETIAPAVASTAVGGARTGDRVAPERLSESIADAIGVHLDSADVKLRDHIPNSLTFLQMLLALEDEYGVTIDYAAMDPGVTVADLAAVIDAARGGADAGSAAGAAAGADPAVATGESDDGCAGKNGAGPADAVPLNPIQTAYLLGADEDIELGGQATYIYAESRHDYSLPQVEEAVRAVFGRHDVLFHRLDIDAGVLSPTGACLATVEVVGSGDDVDAAVGEIRRDMRTAARSSNEDGPMVAARLLADAGGCRMFIYFNMIVMDAGSVYLFFDELESLLAGEPPAPASKYGDALAAISARRRDGKRAEDLAYWEKKAADLPRRPEFPAAVRGDDDWSTRRLGTVLDAEITAKLGERARRIGVTLSSLVMAVNAAVVCRWLPESALTVNVTVSERSGLAAGTRVMGDFTSSMLIGVDAGRAATIDGLAEAIDLDIREGLSHRGVSGVEVLQRFLRDVANQTQATAPVVFTSYLGGERGSGRSPVIERIYTQTAQVCLDIQVMPASGGMTLSWDVVDDYFPAADAMFEAVAEALDVVAEGGEALPIRHAETEGAVARYNDAAGPIHDDTLVSLVEAAYAATPDAPAVRLAARGISYTYAEVWARAGRIARHLSDSGVGAGDAVIVRYTKHPDDIVNMVGALRAGAAFVPVDAGMPAQRQEYVVEASGASGPILDTGVIDELDQSGVAGVGKPAAAEVCDRAGSAGAHPSLGTAPDDLAYVIFTSGTTGRPKGVRISHRNCINTILDVNRRYGVTSADRIIGLSSLGFDLSVYDVFGAFAAGATVTMVGDERDADEILDVLREERVTLWNSAPALLELALVRAADDDVFPDVRTVLLSGDRIAAGLPARAMDMFPNASINSLGGATEGSIWSIHCPLQRDSLENRIPYGYPLANQGIHVLAPDGVHCPVGVPGEIHISGLGVAQGYAADPERTAAAFGDVPGIGRCYRTGDVGIFNAEGFVEFLGRRDRQVKIAGFRVELGEIESVLERSGLVTASMAAVVESGGRGLLACLYVPADDMTGSRDAVRAELARCLPAYMVPTVLLPVAHLPVTVNGKLDQEEIRRHVGTAGGRATADGEVAGAEAGAAGAAGSVAAPGAIELVSGVFDEILGEAPSTSAADPACGAGESFFRRGGDSLQFQVMMRAIRQKTGVRLRFRDVIADPTIAHIAGLVSEAMRESGAESEAVAEAVSSLDCAGGVGSATGGARESSASAHGKDPVEQFGDDPHAPFPLTDMQKAYYVGRNSGFELGGVTEHYYIESVTEPGTDIDRLEDALDNLIRRHPMLRVVFTAQATQRILPEVPRYRIAVADYRAADEATVVEAVRRKRDELSHQVFDLGSWPLFHLSAFALPDGRHRLFFSVDMIIGDGASQRIFIDDLDKLYRGTELPPVTGDYRTYVLEMKRREASAVGRGDETLTRTVVEDFPPGNTLPSIGAAADVDVPRMRRLSHTFTAEETALLRERASAADGSVSALLLACYATSLSLWSRGDSVGINITTYNRDPEIADFAGVFGDFTGVILIPVKAAADYDLRWWTAELRDRLLGHMAAGYSGVSLLGAIARHRGLPVGQAIAPFVYTSLLFGEGSAAGDGSGRDAHVLGDVDYAISQTPQVLLDNQVMEVGGRINVAWDFVEQILEPELVEDIFDHYIRSVSGFAGGCPEAAPLSVGQVRRLRLAVGGTSSSGGAIGDGVAGASSAERDRSGSISRIASGDLMGRVREYLTVITGMVRADLGGAEAGADDDLFLLGYDSLGFVNLMQRIQDITGASVPLAEALAKPTPRGVAELVGQSTATPTDRRDVDDPGTSAADHSLVLLRSGDEARPIFLVHGGFGTVDIYRDLALAIPGGGQVWGVGFAEFERPFPHAIGIGDIAAHYSGRVREVLVDGATPAIVGWSLGGTIAAEMVLRLADLDPALVFLDSLAPGIAVDVGDFGAESEKGLLSRVVPSIADLPHGTPVARLWAEFGGVDETDGERGARLRALAAAVAPTLLEDLGLSGDRVTATEFNSLRSLIDARTRYRPGGRVREALFVLPDDGEAHNHDQWRDHLVDDLCVAGVAGNHYSFVLGEDAALTGALIGEYIERRRRAPETDDRAADPSSEGIDRSRDRGNEMEND
ncbi:amino acid adenylation domain-containing protein [Corynebacterium simulans]